MVVCLLPSPGTSTLVGFQPAVPLNALALHIFIRVCIYAPAYALDTDLVRTLSHMSSISALLVALLGLLGVHL